MNAILSTDGLTKRFGGLTAVDTFSFGVEPGEIRGLIGPNGSGKTTIFNCVMSLYPVSDGSVEFNGEEITDWSTHEIVNTGLARVSQESNPIRGMTVAQNIKLFTLPNEILAFSGGASTDEIYGIADRVGISDTLSELPDSLAHADVRRLEIAKAIATDPELLLLDEPFAGLNHAEIRDLSEQLLQLREDGMTLVIIDHNMKGLMQVVDRVTVINNGEKLVEGSPEEIAEDERVQRAYLAGTEAI